MHVHIMTILGIPSASQTQIRLPIVCILLQFHFRYLLIFLPHGLLNMVNKLLQFRQGGPMEVTGCFFSGKFSSHNKVEGGRELFLTNTMSRIHCGKSWVWCCWRSRELNPHYKQKLEIQDWDESRCVMLVPNEIHTIINHNYQTYYNYHQRSPLIAYYHKLTWRGLQYKVIPINLHKTQCTKRPSMSQSGGKWEATFPTSPPNIINTQALH